MNKNFSKNSCKKIYRKNFQKVSLFQNFESKNYLKFCPKFLAFKVCKSILPCICHFFLDHWLIIKMKS